MPDTLPAPSPRAPDETTPSDRARTPLLELLTAQALDEDYAHVARRRARTGKGPTDARASAATAGPRRSLRGGVVVLACFGALVAVAFVQTSRDASSDEASRAALVDRIEKRRDQVAADQERLARLRESNTRLDTGLRDTTDEAADADAARLRLAARTGFAAVTGPGVKVTVTQPADAEGTQVIRDSDLALLANGLWSAGAEAIAINGQRLVATGAIRNSGEPVEVNGVGVAPPYVVSVIGDRLTLEADFFDTSSGLAFDSLASSYGFGYDFAVADDLALPAAPARLATLRYAGADDGAPANVEPAPGQEPS